MKTLVYTSLSLSQRLELMHLWNKEYPVSLSYSRVEDFDEYVKGLLELNHTLLMNEGGILGWYFQFQRNGRLWFGMILDSEIQGEGYGSMLLDQAKEKTDELNGWVVDNESYLKSDGSCYSSPLGFYKRQSFEVISDTRLQTKEISAVHVQWRK